MSLRKIVDARKKRLKGYKGHQLTLLEGNQRPLHTVMVERKQMAAIAAEYRKTVNLSRRNSTLTA